MFKWSITCVSVDVVNDLGNIEFDSLGEGLTASSFFINRNKNTAYSEELIKLMGDV